MQVTLGGERLGSGKKMEVEMNNYERSTHNLSYVFRSSMAPGTLVPFLKKIALPGDTFDIELNATVLTHPTTGPLYGSYKVQLDVFAIPIRLYQAKLHQNQTGIGLSMQNIKLPMMRLYATKLSENEQDVDNAQVNSSCLLSYLGVRGIGIVRPEEEDSFAQREFNGLPLLMYWEIVKQYYANKQEGIGAVIHTPTTEIIQSVENIEYAASNAGPWTGIAYGTGTSQSFIPNGYTIRITYGGPRPVLNQILIENTSGIPKPIDELTEIISETSTQIYLRLNIGVGNNWGVLYWRYLRTNEAPKQTPQISTFPIENVDLMRNRIMAHAPNNSAFDIKSQDIQPYSWLLATGQDAEENTWTQYTHSQEGLALKTFQSDLYNNYLDSEWIGGPAGINNVSAVSTIDNKFTIDALNLANKVYTMLMRIAVSDGTYQSWLQATWGHTAAGAIEAPVYKGGLIKELIFEEVVSTADVTGTQPLGTLAGKGTMAGKHKGGNVYIKIDEPSYIMGIVSLTPRIDYSQGNDWDMRLKTMNDFHMPELDQIGFQDLIQEDQAWWTTVHGTGYDDFTMKATGKQPAWINYTTSVNKTYGTFAEINNEMFMTLNRRYERDPIENDILDNTTYIDPSKFNFIFAETAIDSQNFWMQVASKITARRKMSAKVIPNL